MYGSKGNWSNFIIAIPVVFILIALTGNWGLAILSIIVLIALAIGAVVAYENNLSKGVRWTHDHPQYRTSMSDDMRRKEQEMIRNGQISDPKKKN